MIFDLVPLAIFDASEFFTWFVDNANYWFVFIFMIVESSFIPFPSELVIPPAAYLSMQPGNDMNIWLVVLVGTAGAVVGALINYYLAMWIGRPLVYGFANSRMGHALFIDAAKVDRAEKYFDKHGAVSTFVGRLIPAVRQLISIPAGLSKMNIGSFVIYTALGAGVWNAVLGFLGYFLSRIVSRDQLFSKVEEYNEYLTYAGYAIGVVCVGLILYNAFKPRRHGMDGM